MPKKKEPLTPAEDFKRILRRSEMDTEMFTVKPLSELSEPEPESRDISSVSEEAEVEVRRPSSAPTTMISTNRYLR